MYLAQVDVILRLSVEYSAKLLRTFRASDVVPVIPVPNNRYYRSIFGTKNIGTESSLISVLSVLEI